MSPIIVEIQRELSVPAHVIFDTFMPIDLTQIMTGFGPLPAVSNIENQSGPWNSVGIERTIRLADGHTMTEVLTEVQRPTGFSYTLGNLTNVLRFFVHRFHGSWCFDTISADGEPSRVRTTWRYEFDVRSRLRRPIAWCILTLFWRPYMKRAFDNATKALPQTK